MALAQFRALLSMYRRAAGFTQKELAAALHLHPTVLSHKLNGTDAATLTHAEMKQIVKTLAGWQAITTRMHAVELLEAAGLKESSFSLREWAAVPLVNLEETKAPSRLPLPAAPNPTPVPHANTASPPPVPVPITPLVGREHEIAQVQALIRRADVRLLTLTGPGGIGKTRLALHCATGVATDFQHGVVFVELAAIHDPTLVIPTIAQALDIHDAGEGSLTSRLREVMREKHMLLVLDNFEQVVTAGTAINALLMHAPHLKIVLTSREVAHLYGEHEYAVPPLHVPDMQRLPTPEALLHNEAVQLFVQRARAAQHDFALTADNAGAVAKICVRLDGLPLAIELAAGQSKRFAPAQLLAQLDNRLALLTGGARNLPPRQQTLRNTIQWSNQLLTAGERRVFRQVAVFVGSWEIAAAEAIVRDTCDGSLQAVLLTLVDKSMIRLMEPGMQPRFAMLETIREYAYEELTASGEIDAVQRHHAAYYLALVEQANPELRGPQQSLWFTRLEHEHANIRAALDWTLAQSDAEPALRFGIALWYFWYAHGYLSEGRQWLELALAHAGPVAVDVRAGALRSAGILANYQGDYDQAILYHTEALALQRSLGNKKEIASTLNSLAHSRRAQGDQAAAVELYTEALALYQDIGFSRGVGVMLHNLGSLTYLRGDPNQATLYFMQALAIARELADPMQIGLTLHDLGNIALYQNDPARAKPLFCQSLAMLHDLGAQEGCAANVAGLAGVAGLEGHFVRAARLYSAATIIEEKIGVNLSRHENDDYQRLLDRARTDADAIEWETGWAEGRTMTLEEAVAFALAQDAEVMAE